MISENRTLTDVPARLDRLPWSAFHRLVMVALGIPGFSTVSSHPGRIRRGGAADQPAASSHGRAGRSDRERLSRRRRAGLLFFGHLTDRLGRKKLFSVTLGVYLVATALTAFSWDFYSFLLFRFLTGAGIGGEYSASTRRSRTDPARLRGRIDLAINAASGSARQAAHFSRWCCSTRTCSGPTWAGAWPSAAAPCWAW